jgi:DMSO/TMAO reductase YedYZ molybdopterin-dependent catalytic subunit
LTIGGLVGKPLQLTLADLLRRPKVTHTVTLECAGNGRALLHPRPASQPWLVQGVSTSEWTGTPLKGVLQDAGVSEQAVDIVFTGLDRGIQGGEAQAYQRSLALT